MQSNQCGTYIQVINFNMMIILNKSKKFNAIGGFNRSVLKIILKVPKFLKNEEVGSVFKNIKKILIFLRYGLFSPIR